MPQDKYTSATDLRNETKLVELSNNQSDDTLESEAEEARRLNRDKLINI